MYTMLLVVITLFVLTNAAPKRGIGIAWNNPKTASRSCDDLASLNVSWFYTWLPVHPCPGDTTVEFIPMIQKQQYMSYVDTINQTGATTLLGFNEPDEPNQADMTVERAIELWPYLMETGLRLGSPSATQYPASQNIDGGGPQWLKWFMGNVTKLNYRVDFICIHYYMFKPPNPYNSIDNLRQFLLNINSSYPGYKVWLTEFNNSTGTVQDNIGYFEAAYKLFTDEFPDLVEAYSWFTDRWDYSAANPNYFTNDANTGQLTQFGQVYASYPK